MIKKMGGIRREFSLPVIEDMMWRLIKRKLRFLQKVLLRFIAQISDAISRAVSKHR